MSVPFCQHICKLRNECEHAYGYANGYTRRRHEDPDYLDENAWRFIRTFSDQTHKNYLLARHLKATSNEQWRTLEWLMQGDLDAVLDKRMGKKMPGTGEKKAMTGQEKEKGDKSIYVPLTNHFGPEGIEEFVSQKQGSEHALDVIMKGMKDEKFDIKFHGSQNKVVKTFPDVIRKRGLGSTGLPRIDMDVERAGKVKSMTQLPHHPTAGYLTSYQQIAEKNQMKSFIKTMNQFYAAVNETQSINVDSVVEELAQTLQEEFYRTFSFHKLSYDKQENTKLRLSAIIRMLKSMPGYETFERVLYHEPFDRDKPWTWLRAFPKRIPNVYLKRISENILNDMKKWKQQQKIIALTYSPRRRVIDLNKNAILQKKRGRRILKNRIQKEKLDDDDI